MQLHVIYTKSLAVITVYCCIANDMCNLHLAVERGVTISLKKR